MQRTRSDRTWTRYFVWKVQKPDSTSHMLALGLMRPLHYWLVTFLVCYLVGISTLARLFFKCGIQKMGMFGISKMVFWKAGIPAQDMPSIDLNGWHFATMELVPWELRNFRNLGLVPWVFHQMS